MKPATAGIWAADQVDPALALYATAMVMVVVSPSEPVDTHCPRAKHWTCTGKNPGGSLASDHVRPPSVVNKATDGSVGCTLLATTTHDATVAHETLVGSWRNPLPDLRLIMATSNALGALVDDHVRPPSLVSDMNHSSFGGAESLLVVRTTQVPGLVHCAPLAGSPGSDSGCQLWPPSRVT